MSKSLLARLNGFLPRWSHKYILLTIAWYLLKFFLRAKFELEHFREIFNAGHSHPKGFRKKLKTFLQARYSMIGQCLDLPALLFTHGHRYVRPPARIECALASPASNANSFSLPLTLTSFRTT